MSETPQKIYIQEAGQYLLISEDVANKLPMILKTFSTLEFKLLSEMTHGEVVKFFRIQSEKSLRDLAGQLSLDHKHLDKMEKGLIKKPNFDVLKKMADIFGAKFVSALEEIGVTIYR